MPVEITRTAKKMVDKTPRFQDGLNNHINSLQKPTSVLQKKGGDQAVDPEVASNHSSVGAMGKLW